MISRWFERIALVGLFLLAMGLRIWDVTQLPLGFSDEELTSINIMNEIDAGTVRVFFATVPDGGQESLYHTLNTIMTYWFGVGDGLLGYRVLSIWLSLLTLACVYRIGRGLFGRGIGLTAMALMVASIHAVLLSRTATPAILVPFWVAAFMAACIWAFELHKPISPVLPHTRRFTLVGLIVAATIYTHYVGVLLALCLLIFILYMYQTRQPVSRLIWSSSFFVLLLIVVLALPYIISIIRNPDSASISVFWRLAPTSPDDFLGSVASTLIAFFYEGDRLPYHNVPNLPLINPIWTVLAIVGLMYAVRRWREPAYMLILIPFGVGLLPDMWLHGDVNYDHLLLLQPSLYILVGLGVYVAAQVIQQSSITRLVGGWRFVAALTILAFAATTWQTYQQFLVGWSERDDVRIAYHSNIAELTYYMDTRRTDLPTLFCTNTLVDSARPDGSIRWSEAEMAEAMLYRENYNMRYAICRSGFVLINGGDTMRVMLSNPRAVNEATAPIRFWLDRLVPFPGEADLPIFTLNVEDEFAQLGGELLNDAGLSYPLPIQPDANTVQLPVRFGRNITLLGYDAPPSEISYQAGAPIVTTTYWRVDGELPPALGIFTRLHDTPQASPYTETNTFDVLPAGLQTRDIIIQSNFMIIPPTLLAGDYLITIGAYDNDPLNQLPVFLNDELDDGGNYLIVQSRLSIEEPE